MKAKLKHIKIDLKYIDLIDLKHKLDDTLARISANHYDFESAELNHSMVCLIEPRTEIRDEKEYLVIPSKINF